MKDELESVYDEVMKYIQAKYPEAWLSQAMLGKEWVALQIKFPRKEAKKYDDHKSHKLTALST